MSMIGKMGRGRIDKVGDKGNAARNIYILTGNSDRNQDNTENDNSASRWTTKKTTTFFGLFTHEYGHPFYKRLAAAS